jgi:hypothetical protein
MADSVKQQRNGNTGRAGEQNTAQPGPDATSQVASVKRQAEAAAIRRKSETAGMIDTAQGSGVNGHQLGANGDMYDWKSGLAVNSTD